MRRKPLIKEEKIEMNKVEGFIKTIDPVLQNFKTVSKQDRIIEGYFSTMDVDRTGDVVLPTAFAKTMPIYMKNPVVTYMHDTRQVIGKTLDYRLDSIGVWAKVQLAKGIKWADDVWSLIEQDMIKAFSFGYKTVDSEPQTRNGQDINVLKEVDLFEIAVVTVPMNGNALFTVAKDGTIKSVVLSELSKLTKEENLNNEGSKQHGNEGDEHEEKEEEDSTEINENTEEKALSHNSTLSDSEPGWGSVDKTKLPRNAFAEMGDPAKKSTWGYPHHWVSGGTVGDNEVFSSGTMYLHKGGLHAAWAAANGARSGQNASAAVKAHLQAHRSAIGEKDIDEIAEQVALYLNLEELPEKVTDMVLTKLQEIEVKRIEQEEKKEKERQTSQEEVTKAAIKDLTAYVKSVVADIKGGKK